MGKKDKKVVEEEEDPSEDVFEVEKILDKRVQHGRTQYSIRWKGFSSDYDTWEDEDNVAGCPELVKEFESSRVQEKKKSRKRKNVIVDEDSIADISSSASSSSASAPTTSQPPTTSSSSSTSNIHSNSIPTSYKTKIENEESIKSGYLKYGIPYAEDIGFENGDCLEEIVGCKPFGESNILYFFVKWRGHDKLTWVPNEVLKHKEPLQLIEFYENRLKFGYKGQDS
ncbi:hypothetical protein ACTA71_010080 [Dictyostelium dimigraforme]